MILRIQNMYSDVLLTVCQISFFITSMIIAAQNASSASNLRQTDTKGPDVTDARTIMLHNNSELFTDAVRHLLPVLVAIDASSAGLSRLLIL
jgi:hypothetical protein